MKQKVRILHVEDNPSDAELVRATLRREGMDCEVKVVDTEDAYVSELECGEFDIILADYSLPSFDGLTALSILKKKRPMLPLIFVSGTMGEDIAIESLKMGVTDYVLKSNLSRLAPAVRRAMREAEEHLERVCAEKALKQRLDELERFRKATIQREFRIKELRDRVRELEYELGRNLRP